MTHLDHQEIRERLQDLIDGDLPCNEQRELESHIQRCPSCRGELESLADTVGLLRALPHPQAPPDLAAKARRRVRRRSGVERRRPRLESSIPSISAVVVLIAAVALIGTRLVAPIPHEAETTSPEEPPPAETGRSEAKASMSPQTYSSLADRSPPEHSVTIRLSEREMVHRALVLAESAGGVDETGRPFTAPESSESVGFDEKVFFLPRTLALLIANDVMQQHGSSPEPITHESVMELLRAPAELGAGGELESEGTSARGVPPHHVGISVALEPLD